MPELPEVETIRRGLALLVEGARVTSVTPTRSGLRIPFPEDLEDIIGARIDTVGRRGKYLLFALSDRRMLISHLGMTGTWRLEAEDGGEAVRLLIGKRKPVHDHLFIGVERDGRGARLVYNDPRRFGSILLTANTETAGPLRDLGPEPLGNGFSANYLAGVCAGRSAPVKSVLLDQKTVAGLGNIYALEALWRAGIAPDRPAGRLTEARIAALAAAIHDVLAEAMDAGGSTLNNFVDAAGGAGTFQHRFDVYDREGAPCRKPGCGGTIRRMVQSGRSSYFCPVCQGK